MEGDRPNERGRIQVQDHSPGVQQPLPNPFRGILGMEKSSNSSLLAERTPRLPKRKMQSRDYIHDQIQEYLKEKEEEIAKLKEEIQGLREVQHDVYYIEGQIEALTSENQRLKQEQRETEAEKEMWKKRCRMAEASGRRLT